MNGPTGLSGEVGFSGAVAAQARQTSDRSAGEIGEPAADQDFAVRLDCQRTNVLVGAGAGVEIGIERSVGVEARQAGA